MNLSNKHLNQPLSCVKMIFNLAKDSLNDLTWSVNELMSSLLWIKSLDSWDDDDEDNDTSDNARGILAIIQLLYNTSILIDKNRSKIVNLKKKQNEVQNKNKTEKICGWKLQQFENRTEQNRTETI